MTHKYIKISTNRSFGLIFSYFFKVKKGKN
jgi:hypothetical protein